MAAIDAGLITTPLVQPYRYPQTGPYARVRYTYCPPASGSAAPSSATDSAPSRDTTPPTTQTRIAGPVAWSPPAMALGTMKIADAMIVPTLIIVESSRPSWRFSSATTQPVAVGPFQELLEMIDALLESH